MAPCSQESQALPAMAGVSSTAQAEAAPLVAMVASLPARAATRLALTAATRTGTVSPRLRAPRLVRMRVAYVLHQFLPNYFSGTEQYVHAIAKAMQGRGHEVGVFALEPLFVPLPPFEQTDDRVDGLPITRVRFDPAIHGNAMRVEYQHAYIGDRFGEWLDAVRPHVVHVFHLRYLGGNLLDETRRRGVPTIVHLMDFWFLCPRFTLLRHDDALCDGPPDGGAGCLPCVNPEMAKAVDRLGLTATTRRLGPLWSGAGFRVGQGLQTFVDALSQRPAWLRARLLQADAIVAPSRFLRTMFVRNGYPEARIEVLPYGIAPLPRPLPRPLALPHSLPHSTVAPGRLRVGYLGTLAHHKGVHVAVAAVQQLDEPAIELQIHGRTTDFPDYCVPLQQAAAADCRIRICGPYDRPALARVLAGVDVVVVPSLWYENTPFVVLEALGAGVPVFASDLGGMSELVLDGDNGELFAPGDAADLGQRLARCLREPDRLAGYRRRIGAVKTIAQNVDEIEAVYARLVARRNALSPGPVTS